MSNEKDKREINLSRRKTKGVLFIKSDFKTINKITEILNLIKSETIKIEEMKVYPMFEVFDFEPILTKYRRGVGKG